MTKIKNIVARQIFDSRGNPTVEADVITSNGVLGRAAVPSGASTGEHEAVELRDGTNDFMGKSVYHAVRNVNDLILKKLKNLSVFSNQKVLIKGCASVPIPTWAYMMITARLTEYANQVLYGELCSAYSIFEKS